MKPSRWTLAGAVIAIVAAAAAWVSARAEKPFATEVAVESGALAGVVGDGVLSFKGVPFAAPPIGELRWRAPQPVTKWAGIRKADAFGHDCMQLPFRW